MQEVGHRDLRAQLVQPRTSKISIRKQCELLSVNRSRVYYKPVDEKPENIEMMNIMDRHLTKHPTEGVVSISNTMSALWCRNVLEDAIATHGKPEIVNSDQGCQYTSALWTQYLEQQGISTSMDGKGRALDNVWIERFWKSLKYDYIYLNPVDDKIHHTTEQTPNKRYEESIKKAA